MELKVGNRVEVEAESTEQRPRMGVIEEEVRRHPPLATPDESDGYKSLAEGAKVRLGGRGFQGHDRRTAPHRPIRGSSIVRSWPCGQQSRPESGDTPTRGVRGEVTHPEAHGIDCGASRP